jgi:hypothetical protein
MAGTSSLRRGRIGQQGTVKLHWNGNICTDLLEQRRAHEATPAVLNCNSLGWGLVGRGRRADYGCCAQDRSSRWPRVDGAENCGARVSGAGEWGHAWVGACSCVGCDDHWPLAGQRMFHWGEFWACEWVECVLGACGLDCVCSSLATDLVPFKISQP